jgi:hypothetical protein
LTGSHISLVSVPTIVGCIGAAVIATPIAKSQHARQMWFYIMSSGTVAKILTMEIASILYKI